MAKVSKAAKKPVKKTTAVKVKKAAPVKKVTAKKAAPKRKAAAKKAAPKKRVIGKKAVAKKPAAAKKTAPKKVHNAEECLLVHMNAILQSDGKDYIKQASLLLDTLPNKMHDHTWLESFYSLPEKLSEFKQSHGLDIRSPRSENNHEKWVKSLLTLLNTHVDAENSKLNKAFIFKIEQALTENKKALVAILKENAGLAFELYYSGILPNEFYTSDVDPDIKAIAHYIDKKMPPEIQALCLHPEHPLGKAFSASRKLRLCDTRKSAEEIDALTKSAGSHKKDKKMMVAEIVSENKKEKITDNDLQFLLEEIKTIAAKWKQHALEHALPPLEERGTNESAYKLVREQNMRILEAIWDATHDELHLLQKQLGNNVHPTPHLKLQEKDLLERQAWLGQADKSDWKMLRKSDSGERHGQPWQGKRGGFSVDQKRAFGLHNARTYKNKI